MWDKFERFVVKNKRLLLILLLAFFLITPGISQVDLLGDNGHYFIRAVGYVDHVFSGQQTTPIDWYEQFPKWAFLSFHDHPFLLFFVQHIFISLHESLFFAKLPYVLFSLGAIWLMYLWLREEYDEKLAETAAILLAINPLFVWTTRAGFMEAGVIFFIALSFYYFSKFCRNEKYWFLFGLSLGLAFLSKYNTFFLIPTFFFYLLFFNRERLKNKKTYFAVLVSLLVFLPSIIYNILLYKTRGHFDYQFSRLFHIKSPWGVGNVGDAWNSPWNTFMGLGQSTTFVYLGLALFGLLLALKNRKLFLPIIGTVFLTLLFVATGSGNQYANLYSVMIAPFVAYFFISIKQKSVSGYKILFYILSAYFIFIIINSNILIKPILGPVGMIISSAQSKNYGFYQLDRYMEKMMKDYKINNQAEGYRHIKSKYPAWIEKYGVPPQITNNNLENVDNLIVFDQDINWFARLWALTRIQFYYNAPIVSVAEFLNQAENLKNVRTLFYIQATENTLLDGVNDYSETGRELVQSIMEEGGTELESIYRSDGKAAFRVYKLESK